MVICRPSHIHPAICAFSPSFTTAVSSIHKCPRKPRVVTCGCFCEDRGHEHGVHNDHVTMLWDPSMGSGFLVKSLCLFLLVSGCAQKGWQVGTWGYGAGSGEIRPHSLLFHSFASYGLRLASVETFLYLSPKSLRGGHCLSFSSRLILPYVMLTVRYLLLCVFNNNEKSVGLIQAIAWVNTDNTLSERSHPDHMHI